MLRFLKYFGLVVLILISLRVLDRIPNPGSRNTDRLMSFGLVFRSIVVNASRFVSHITSCFCRHTARTCYRRAEIVGWPT